jgi:dTDP-glucose 4,6-dehydratase
VTGRRVAVTGGAGFVGTHLCRSLLAAGDQVVAVDNLLTGRMENIADLLDDPRFTFVRRDVTEPFNVDGPLDAVLHFASPASPADFARIPIEIMRVGSDGTHNTLELAKAKGARYMLASTSEVYGDPEVHPQPEAYRGNVSSTGPRAVYDEAKRFAEAMTMAYNRTFALDVRIVRIFNTYGPNMRHDDGRVVSNFLVQALAGERLTVHGDGSQTRSFCYVDDEVRGILALLDSDYVGPVNIGNPDEYTVLELAEAVLEVTGSSSRIEYLPLPVDDPTRRCPDIGLATAKLGWKPEIGLREGLSRTAPWFARG